MFEAYKVGVTIALTNHVSKALLGMRRDFQGTDAQAKKLQATMHGIERTALKGALGVGLGYGLLKPLQAGYQAAKKYEQAFAAFKSLNLGDGINSQADKFAKGANIIGASATDLMQISRDLTVVLGDKGQGMVQQLAPGFAQLKFANQAVFGGHGLNFDERQMRDFERIVEMKGGFKSAADFLGQAGMLQQAVAATGGLVMPADFIAFIKTAGVSGRLLNNKAFYYGMEPLIQEMGGSRVGTGMQTGYNQWAMGHLPQAAAEEMVRLGLFDTKKIEYSKIGTIKRVKPGALKDMDGFGENRFEWMKEVYLPALKAKGITSEKDILKEIGFTAPNRTWSALLSLMYLQIEKIDKNMAMSEGAMSSDAIIKMAKTNPEGAERAMGAAWTNLKIAAGEVLIPLVIPAIVKFTNGLRALGGWIEAHPTAFKTIIYGLMGIGAALTFGGSLLLVKAGLKGLAIVFGPAGKLIKGIGSLSGALSGPGGSLLRSVGSLTLALGPLGLALGSIAIAAGAIYLAKDKIAERSRQAAGFIDKYAPAIGDGLMGARDWLSQGDSLSGLPPRKGGGGSTHVTVNIDGQTAWNALAPHQERAMSKPSSGTGFFDIGKTMASPGASYAQ